MRLTLVLSLALQTSSPIAVAPQLRPAASTPRIFRKDEAIFMQGDPASCIYTVISGAVRTCQLLRDGSRQVDGFFLPGDVFGIECTKLYSFSAEAIDTTAVRIVPRHLWNEAGEADEATGGSAFDAVMHALERTRAHRLLLGRKNAVQKVAAFLLDLSDRMDEQDCFDLPMSRNDIGDYLGLTIETVSRTLCQLERDGIIELPRHRRCMVLRDRRRLQRLDI